jgi:magnesium transporter
MNLFPGNPVYVGDREAREMDLSLIEYDARDAAFIEPAGIEEAARHRDDSKITWINISGLKDIDAIKRLGVLYRLHPLTIEDILHTEQQPKVEIFDDYRFLSIKTIQQEKSFAGYTQNRKKKKEIDGFLIDQISVIIMEKTLITIQ